MDRRHRLAALGLGLATLFAGSAQAQVVISQVYGGGGNAGAPLRSDFIELHNTGGASVDVSTWSVQYTSSAGTSWALTRLSGSIAPGGYYLVKEADGAGTQPALPQPDATGTIAMASAAGKVALVASQTALSGTCPTGAVDFVGFGTAANCAEGNAPTPTLSNTLAALRTDDCVDSDNNAADFATATPRPRNRASTARVCGNGQAVANIDDPSVTEGDSGTRTLTFTVALTRPAAAGGVSFRWSTLDGSATSADGDYVAVAPGTVTIPAGADRVQFAVTVNGDTRVEPTETLRVLLTDLVGALAGDVDGTGSIVNDDFSITPIAQIQGPGAASPLAGQVVATRGIVTGRTSRGFFLQSRDVDADADPATSEGVYVFLNAAPPAIAQPGRWVTVQGTVQEFVPSTDPGQAPLTEIVAVSTVLAQDDTVYPLPAPVVLTTTFPAPGGGLDQLERVEGMRVRVPDFVATAPTDGFKNEAQATSSSTGQFYGTVAGVPRPFREPGIQAPDAPPSGSVPPIPQWDFNPEVLSVDSDGLLGMPALDVAAGARIADLTGPLTFSFRRPQILPDAMGTLTPGAAPRPVQPVPAEAFSVAGYNMERFFDDVDDPGVSDVRLPAAALERRLSKASLGIREALRLPDILAVVEMENLAVLTRVADRVNADAAAAGAPNPGYVPYLVEGNDVGGIDVGFLVKTMDVGGAPRVEVRSVVQVGKDATYPTPDGGTSLLNDRPPLVLDAVVHYADGRSFPLNVVAVHNRSLNGADTPDASGERIRLKRQRQADFLAAYLDARQKAAPDTRLVVLGDFNAFEFNDGLVDAMGTITGAPAPDAETAVPGDGVDLVEPNLVNITALEPREERYSFTFDGNAQSLDHVLVNEDMVVATRLIEVDHARINADFPETNRNDAASPSRLADHDPVIAYFVPRRTADLAISAMARPAGSGLPGFDVTLANLGPDQADRPVVGLDVDAALPGLRVTAPPGWTCGAPAVSASTTSVLCDTQAFANGGSATFALDVEPDASTEGRRITLVAAVKGESLDPAPSNDAATAGLDVRTAADVSVELAAPDTHLRRGATALYRLTVGNAGPDAAVGVSAVVTGESAGGVVVDPVPGWSCNVAGDGSAFRATCTTPRLAPATIVELPLRLVAPTRRGQPHFTVAARVTTLSVDANGANDSSRTSVVLTGPGR